MANIVVTSSTNRVDVDFGVYSSVTGFSKGSWVKNNILNFLLDASAAKVYVLILDEDRYALSHNGAAGTMQVDTVAGATPSSTSDLFDKLIALI
jgi:hypothetical protein